MVLSAFSPNLHTTNLPPWASACSCLGYRTVAMVAESGGYEFNGHVLVSDGCYSDRIAFLLAREEAATEGLWVSGA